MTVRLTAVLLLAVATGCFQKYARGFDPARTQKVVVWSNGMRDVHAIEDRAEVEALVACLARAERVREASRGPVTHKLQIHGPNGGSWMLDAASGELAFLTVKARKPVYRLGEADLETVRRLLAPAPDRSP